VLTPELSVLDPGAAIQFSFQPATLSFNGGGSAPTVLTVNVTSLSPSFNLSLFHVVATDPSNPQITGQIQVSLQVKALFKVQLLGRQSSTAASPERWSIPTGAVTKFISHPEGMTITFQNMDTSVTHLIHSGGGPIPHEEDGGIAPSPDGTTAVGGYTIVVPPGTTTGTSGVYCHDHEGGNQVRTFQFNVPVVAAKPTGPSGNANAKFSYINANVIQASCIGCHSAANASDGINLASYAMVAAHVTAGNAAVSPFYNVVAPPNPSMPKGGAPLSAALVQDIQDWINDGAANN
jgi:hypothetical protein